MGRWMDILRPACEETATIADPQTQSRALEKKTVMVSLSNLMTFPFVAEAVHSGRLSLHGLWIEIGSGALETYDPNVDRFVPV